LSRRLFASLLSVILVLGMFTLAIWAGALDTISNANLIGAGSGIIYGILICLYINETWDPVELREVKPVNGSIFSTPTPLVVAFIVGFIAVIVVSSTYNVRATEFYGPGAMVVLAITFMYAVFRIITSRVNPK